MMAKPQATASGHRRNGAVGFLFLVEMVGDSVGGGCLAAAGAAVDGGGEDCGEDAQLLRFCGLSLTAILRSLQCAGWADHRVAGGDLSGSALYLKRLYRYRTAIFKVWRALLLLETGTMP